MTPDQPYEEMSNRVQEYSETWRTLLQCLCSADDFDRELIIIDAIEPFEMALKEFAQRINVITCPSIQVYMEVTHWRTKIMMMHAEVLESMGETDLAETLYLECEQLLHDKSHKIEVLLGALRCSIQRASYRGHGPEERSLEILATLMAHWIDACDADIAVSIREISRWSMCETILMAEHDAEDGELNIVMPRLLRTFMNQYMTPLWLHHLFTGLLHDLNGRIDGFHEEIQNTQNCFDPEHFPTCREVCNELMNPRFTY